MQFKFKHLTVSKPTTIRTHPNPSSLFPASRRPTSGAAAKESTGMAACAATRMESLTTLVLAGEAGGSAGNQWIYTGYKGIESIIIHHPSYS